MTNSKELVLVGLNQQTKGLGMSEQKYQKLQQDLKILIVKGRDEAIKIANQSINKTYWQIGKRICEEVIAQDKQNLILSNLAEFLNLEVSVLSRSVAFFKTYPNFRPTKNDNLTWSHYRLLIVIKDKKIRNNLERNARNENWSVKQLTFAIQQSATGQIIDQKKSLLTRPTAPTYLYKAKVVNIIDGDTLILNIDLGFQVSKEQRIRLAGIDAPEINTKEGVASKDFLRQKLQNLDFVMVKTRKIDIYGRFIGHIFYDLTDSKDKDEIFLNGVYLNDEILKAGMANLF
jgi:endonuclease YncB( thermonuclease family)